MCPLLRSKILSSPREEIDLLVGSFGGLGKFFHEGLYSRRFVTSVALDEVDTLLDDTFKVDTELFKKYINKELRQLRQFCALGGDHTKKCSAAALSV